VDIGDSSLCGAPAQHSPPETNPSNPMVCLLPSGSMNTEPTGTAGTHERMLRLILLAIGLAELGAVMGICMPVSLMKTIHSWLGLGAMPEGVLVPYLARSLSAFYVVHAGIMLICAIDLRRYAPMIIYLAWAGIAFASLVTFLDIQAGFPWYWWAVEGPGLIVLSIAMLVLVRRVPASA
jgi:hypothetical protein